MKLSRECGARLKDNRLADHGESLYDERPCPNDRRQLRDYCNSRGRRRDLAQAKAEAFEIRVSAGHMLKVASCWILGGTLL